VCSNGSMTTKNMTAPESGWRFAQEWSSAMGEESGSSPSREKEQPSTSPSRGIPSESAPARLNLLLAEDNLPDALLVREAIRLESLPIDVHVASDGQRAIEFIDQSDKDSNAPCPHVLLLDINLPKADGFEVLRRLRASERCGKVPVLMISSSDSPLDRNQAAQLGAGYFRKPPSYDEFLKLGEVLRKLLKDHGML
jgi:chemotaxis family two-component system response regulator Rcp1